MTDDIDAQNLEKFTKPYNPAETEPRIYAEWEKAGYFNPDNLPAPLASENSVGKGRPFTIVMPPPNANGSLHAGHAVFVAIEDLITRFRRMQGYKALWLPGADHAGFETQVVYEKKLEKEGRSRFGMDPDKLREEIMDFTLHNKSYMEGQLRELGASCDWSREKFTLDPDIIKTVYGTFKKLHEDGLLYRGKRTVNWCSKHQTSLSELETISTEENSPFYYFKYGPFTIGTVRPETKFGDKYVVMHPDDARYAEWKHGDTFETEWINGPITATVIKDEAATMEMGTGVMTITPWHSQIDFEIAKRHNLDMEQIIGWDGKLLSIAQEFAGMKITEARPKIVEKLETKGLVERVDTEYKNAVKRCYKCNTIIEPQIKDQWFVSMKPLAEKALDAIERDEVVFYPDHYKKIMTHWLTNIEDWNISRQIVWGIPIPAWFKGDEVFVGEEAPNNLWVKDTDTFDTWFSSGQWPFATLDFPDGEDFKKFYPTQVMETGGDIIFFWVARMLMLGLYRTGEVPFKDVYLHGLVVAKDGSKMSKSKGNVISPIELSQKYGTDALRMGLIIGTTPGTSVALSEDKIKGYKHFANKIWNISRFIFDNTKDAALDTQLAQTDITLWEEMQKLTTEVTKDIEEYRFYLAGEKLYHYGWNRLADQILEESKIGFADAASGANDAENSKLHDAANSRRTVLRKLLSQLLTLLHPFMPFVTEEIWQSMPEHTTPLIVSSWPE
jgi:valyl-tRNA synthetase